MYNIYLFFILFFLRLSLIANDESHCLYSEINFFGGSILVVIYEALLDSAGGQKYSAPSENETHK